MTASRVCFITTSGGRYGLGHLSRCGSIAQQLSAEGHDVQILLGQESRPTERERLLGPIISRLGTELSVFDNQGTRSVHPTLLETLETDKPDTVFLDFYEIGPRFQATVNNICPQTIVIDDQASDSFICGHLINYAPAVSAVDYRGRAADTTELHLGLDFFPISESLRAQKAQTGRQNYLAVCLGGTGCGEATLALTRQLQRCDIVDHFDQIIVINGLTPQDQVGLNLGDKFRTVSEPSNYAELIANARVAITGAGVTALERVYLESPGIIVVTADNQEPNFRYLTDNNIFVGHRPDTQGPRELNDAIRESLERPVRNNIIDGMAVNRIAEIVRDRAQAS